MNDSTFEEIDVIDLDNVTCGKVTKAELYDRRLPHRIVHVFTISGEQVFIQKRGDHVSYLPGHYCTSAGGHVQAGEHPDDAALRELNEELGLYGPIEKICEFWFDGVCRTRIYLYVKLTGPLDKMRYSEREVAGGISISLHGQECLDESLCHPQLLPCLRHLRQWWSLRC
jgi:8-oxo-dGTP pyrophosphatase MutT (NUDIX family)